MSQRKKQFIAGAICPECSEMDSLVLYKESEDIECVSCGLKQSANQREEQANKKVPVKAHKNVDESQSIKITNLTD